MDVISCSCCAVGKSCSKKCSCTANVLSCISYCVCEGGGDCFNSLSQYEPAAMDGGYEEVDDFEERHDE